MKLSRKVIAWILAVALAVCGLPVSTVASAEDTSPRMKFVEKSYDQSTGILTMALKVRTDEVGSNISVKETGVTFGDAKRQRVSEGYFAFRYDADVMVPITRPRDGVARQEIKSVGKPVAVVVNDGSSAMTQYLQSEADTVTRVLHDGRTLNFIEAMDPVCAPSTAYTGLLVSKERINTENRLADAYVQFGFEDAESEHQQADADGEDAGFITVMELDFLCQVEDDHGNLSPAPSDEFLHFGSFRVVDDSDLAAFKNLFFSDSAGGTLVQGAAGFTETYRAQKATKPFFESKYSGFYYGGAPAETLWRGATNDPSPTQVTEPAAPEVRFTNCDQQYTITGFSANTENKYAGQPIETSEPDPASGGEGGGEGSESSTPEVPDHPGEDPEVPVYPNDPAQVDFVVPDGESGFYPRYDIPDYERSKENEAAFTKGIEGEEGGSTDAWVPVSHGLKHFWEGESNDLAKTPKIVYYLNADVEVVRGAEDYPQKDMADFMNHLKWDFLLDDNTSLEDLESRGYSFQTRSGGEITAIGRNGNPVTYLVEEATIVDPTYECSACHYRQEGPWTGACPNLDCQQAGTCRITDHRCSECGYAQVGAWTGLCPNEKCNQSGTCTVAGTNPYTNVLGNTLKGAKVWRLYEKAGTAKGAYVMTTPVGVVIDYLKSTVNYLNPLDGNKAVSAEVLAPQLHVTHLAADVDSLIWRMAQAGTVTLGVVYDGVPTAKYPIKTKLYKDARRVESLTEVYADDLIQELSDGSGFWVGKQNLDGTGEITRNDALTTTMNETTGEPGVSLSAVLYDQYHTPFQDRFPALVIEPADSQTSEKILAKGMVGTGGKPLVPMVITRDADVQEENRDPVTAAYDAYTIRYRKKADGSYYNANDVAAGNYLIRAIYTPEDQTDPVAAIPVSFIMWKAPDYLAYLDVSITGGRGEDVSGSEQPCTMENKKYYREMNATFAIPPRDGTTYQEVTKVGRIVLDEIANQWRQQETDPSRYDVVPGIRDGQGAISQTLCESKNITVDYRLDGFVQPNGKPQTGFRAADIENRNGVRYLKDGSFQYTSLVPNNTSFTVTVTAAYEGYTAEIKINAKFVQESKGLQQIIVSQADDPSIVAGYDIDVPLRDGVSKSVNILAKDIYGSDLRWTGSAPSVQDSTGDGSYKIRLLDSNQKIMMKGPGNPLVPTAGQPADVNPKVHVTSTGTITVDALAQPVDFYLQVVHETTGKESNKFKVSVQRQSNRPSVTKDLDYLDSTLTAPGANDDPVTTIPLALTVINQYGDELDQANGDYTVSYRLTNVLPAEAKGYITISNVDVYECGNSGCGHSAGTPWTVCPECGQNNTCVQTIRNGEVTVQKFAPACTFTVEAVATTPNGVSSLQPATLNFTVVRDEAKYQRFAIDGSSYTESYRCTHAGCTHAGNTPWDTCPVCSTADSCQRVLTGLDYPVQSRQLYALGTNQYTQDQTQMTREDPANITWELLAVSFPDSTVNSISAVGGKYTARAVSLTTDGLITIAGATTIKDVPTALQVRATADGMVATGGNKTDTVWVNVRMATRVPTTIFIGEDYRSIDVELPQLNQQTIIFLAAEVKDQYNIKMDAETAQLKWSAPAKTGFVLEEGTSRVRVLHTVSMESDPGEAPNVLEVDVELPGTSLKVAKAVTITVNQDPANTWVDTIQVTGISDYQTSAQVPGSVVVLPAANSAEASYTLTKAMTENHGLPYGGVAYWEILSAQVGSETWNASDPAGSAKLGQFAEMFNVEPGTKKSRYGSIKFYYNEKVRDALKAGQTVSVTVKATTAGTKNSLDPPATISAEGTVTFKLDENRVPSSAAAVADTSLGKWDVTNAEHPSPEVPNRDTGINVVGLRAVVYDQYGLECSGGATMSLDGDYKAEELVFTDLGENKATLALSWQFRGREIKINVWPSNLTADAASQLSIPVTPAAAYPLELVIPENENRTEYPIPYWTDPLDEAADQEAREANLPPQTVNESILDRLCAKVFNSVGLWMYEEAKLNHDPRPVWTSYGAEKSFDESQYAIDGFATVHLPEKLDFTADQNASEAQKVSVDENTVLRTEYLKLVVNNRAAELLEPGQMTLPVRLLVRTASGAGYITAYDDFTKEVTLSLTREAPRARYMYLDDVDADGKLAIQLQDGSVQTALWRPEQGQDPVTYTVHPSIFDQYGIPYEVPVGILNREFDPTLPDDSEQKVSLELIKPDVSNPDPGSKVFVEPILEPVGDGAETEDEGEAPAKTVGYRIYHVEYPETDVPAPGEGDAGQEPDQEPEAPADPVPSVKKLMAEFDRQTGTVSITSDCDTDLLDEIRIQAHYLPLNGASLAGKKSISIALREESARPAKVLLEHSLPLLEVDSTEDPIMNDEVRPVILDQFGDPYEGETPRINWYLWMPDVNEDGTYQLRTRYSESIVKTEVDEETKEETTTVTPLEEDEWLLKMVGGRNSAVLTVNPAKYVVDRSAVLECRVYDPTNEASIAAPASIAELVHVGKKPTPERPGGFYVPSSVTVRFDAGEFGKLVGSDTQVLEAGQTVTGSPGVKTTTGYGFIGWSIDGENPVDLTQYELNTDTVFIAVFRDVASGKFLTGYHDDTVRPNNRITRAEFMTLVVRAMGGYVPDYHYGPSFLDVSEKSWYGNYIAYAKLQGIASGYPDGTFHPNQLITRGEAARLLAVTVGLSLDNRKSFPDVPENRYFSTSIAALKDAGVASGFSDGTYRPFDYLTRAQAIRLIVGLTNNALDSFQKKNIVECAYCPFIDVNRDSWAYAYILRAAGLA